MPSLIIDNNQIKTSFFASPDNSIHIGELESHVQKYPERWETAFDFLTQLDIENQEIGQIELNKEVYVSVTEYDTRTVDESCYESHKKYIDIQYLISGQEYIAVNRNSSWLKITRPYDSEKDYANYEYDGQKLLLANQKNFFIFFPADAHMPCIKVGKKAKVKKLVIKIQYH